MSHIQKSSSITKGKSLEDKFAAWIKDEKGYDSTENNKNVSPKSGGASYEVDVYATRRDRRSDRAMKVGFAIYIIVWGVYALGLQKAQETLESMVVAVAPELAGSAFFVFLIIGAAVALYNGKRLETRTYIECKNWKRKVGRPQISRLVGRMHNFGDAERRKKGRENWIFVSAKGFSRPALEAAAEHQISCYKSTSDGFKEVLLG